MAQICTKSFVGWGFAPDPTGGAYSAPPDPLTALRGPTSKGREGEGRGRGGKGQGRGGERTGGNGKRGVGGRGLQLKTILILRPGSSIHPFSGKHECGPDFCRSSNIFVHI